MNKIKLPAKSKHKGLYVYCSSCRGYFSWTQRKTKNLLDKLINEEPNCKENGKKLSSCKFKDKHHFKSRIYLPGGTKKVSRTLTATNYTDAVIQAIEFEKEVKDPKNYSNSNEVVLERNYLFDTEIRYLDFLANVGVPEHHQVQRSEKHIKEIQKSLELFNEALNLAKVNKKMLLIDKITDTHVGYFHSYLINNKSYSNKTYNNKMTALKGFYKWINVEFELNTTNPFEKVRKRSVVFKKDTITQKEFKNLLEIISPDRGIVTTGIKDKKTRNRYKPYLKDGIELALHTGGRREEVVDLKWNMIQYVDNEPTYILMKNLKVERQLGEGFNDNVAPKIIPITKSLKNLLYRLGYDNKKGRDEYILVPDRTKTSTYAIMDNLTKGFSHFYNQLNTGRTLYLKSLRKTYLTYLSSALTGDTKSLSSHASDEVLKKHYIDEKIINKAVKDVNIFG